LDYHLLLKTKQNPNKEVLWQGLNWQIGDGSAVRMLKDPWVSSIHLFFTPSSWVSTEGSENATVDCYITSLRQ